MQFIAEIGSNWCGDPQLAFEHIDAASQVGATGVKFQLFRVKELYQKPHPELEKFELPLSLLMPLRDHAHQKGLTFSVTPFSPELAEQCRCLIDTVKISAYDLTYDDLVEAAARLQQPIVLSTAMASLPEISHALIKIRRIQRGYHRITLLHGTAAYPAPLEAANLRRISALRANFPLYDVGLSDHTLGGEAALLAVALGATHIEKHFVLRELTESPDYHVSAYPEEFAGMVVECLDVATQLGSPQPDIPLDIERPLFETCRRTNGQPLRRI